MAQLAEAAANVPAVGFRLEDAVPDVVPDDPKRKRLSGIPMARAKVAKANAALDKAHGKVALLSSDPGLRTQTKKQKQLQLAEESVTKHTEELRDAVKKVEELVEKATQQKESAEAKQKAAEEKAMDKKIISDLATIQVVEIRLKYQSRFDNSTDTSANIWEHIAAEYNKLITDNVLADHDLLSVQQLQRRYNLEYGEFKKWCDVAIRAVQDSGVEASKVEECVEKHRRVTTRIFNKHNYAARPMAAPPLTMESDTALRGGQVNWLSPKVAAAHCGLP